VTEQNSRGDEAVPPDPQRIVGPATYTNSNPSISVVPILMVLGFMVVGAAIWFDFTYNPPLWLHAVIWPPVTVILAIAMTRYLKSFLAVQQYHVRKTEMGL
jgi:uncharacterized protein (DUF983 family)